jgi:hypothetical protein
MDIEQEFVHALFDEYLHLPLLNDIHAIPNFTLADDYLPSGVDFA